MLHHSRRVILEAGVIAAITTAVCAAILPVLRTGPGSPDDDTCLSHLRQLGQASRMYENDWNAQLLPYVVSVPSPGVSKRWTSVLLPYVVDIGIFRCPLDHLDQPTTTGGIPTAYGINWYISSMVGTMFGFTYPSRPYSFVKAPEATIQLADTALVTSETAGLPPDLWAEDLLRAGTADTSYFYLPQNPLYGGNESGWAGGGSGASFLRPFPRHSGVVNVAFYDGSAAAVPAAQFDPAVTRFGMDSCLWDNVAPPVPPYTMSEAALALKISAGLETSTTDRMKRLNVVLEGDSKSVVDAADAVRIARKAGGIEANP
ncbi:MAG TPA: H-X9-DG-CTERM domain-containing protein [Armatimonadota bacterium]|jgi:prepilin-type processing-associated H-X9-DG protein